MAELIHEPHPIVQLKECNYISDCLRSGILQLEVNVQLDRLGQKILSNLLFIWTPKNSEKVHLQILTVKLYTSELVYG